MGLDRGWGHTRLAPFVAACFALGGCFGSSGGGGGEGVGGSAGGPGIAACDRFMACGGDPVGTWTLEDLCLDLDAAELLGLDDPACNDAVRNLNVMPDAVATISESSFELVGDFMMELDFVFDDACVRSLAGDPRAGVDATFCNALADNFNMADPTSTIDSGSCSLVGAECRCRVFSKPQDISEFGTFEIQGDRFVYPTGSQEAFCVDGDRLSIDTPTMMGIGGVLEFQRQ